MFFFYRGSGSFPFENFRGFIFKIYILFCYYSKNRLGVGTVDNLTLSWKLEVESAKNIIDPPKIEYLKWIIHDGRPDKTLYALQRPEL